MNDDWFSSSPDGDGHEGPTPHFELVRILEAEAAHFSAPNDPAVKRIREYVDARCDSFGRVWVHADTVRGDFDVPVQRSVEGEIPVGLSMQMEQEYLQLSLFSNHPDVQVSLGHEEITASVMDLLGAIVVERSDVRETTLVADMVGLLRRHGSPLDQIADMAMAVFDVILSIAASRDLYLWDAHEFYLNLLVPNGKTDLSDQGD